MNERVPSCKPFPAHGFAPNHAPDSLNGSSPMLWSDHTLGAYTDPEYADDDCTLPARGNGTKGCQLGVIVVPAPAPGGEPFTLADPRLTAAAATAEAEGDPRAMAAAR